MAVCKTISSVTDPLSQENLSQQQIREFNDMFKLFDKDGDGAISREDLEATLKQLGNNHNLYNFSNC